MFYENDTIFSYGRHFPIAKFITNSKGIEFIAYNKATYSNSTSKHQKHVLNAIPKNIKKIYCINLECSFLGHHENLLHRLKTAKKLLNDAKKATKYKMQYINNAQSELNAFNEYVNYFEINTSEYVGAYENIDKVYINVSNDIETFINSDEYKIWILNTEKRKNDEISKQLIKQAENIQKFRNFEISYLYGIPFNLLRYNKEKNEVQTSSDVKISLPLFMRYYNKLKNNELNKGEKIENYTYLGKDDKSVFVGCHKIELTEIENIIRFTEDR
jgi:hypothetical protein